MNEFIEYQECPRCGFMAYERLSTHSFCSDCNYSPDISEGTYHEIPNWVLAHQDRRSPADLHSKSARAAA